MVSTPTVASSPLPWPHPGCDGALELRWMPIAELKPAPYNPRRPLKPGSPAYRKLRRSLETFGLVEPLIWNRQSQWLVGGHARLMILRELNIQNVPVTVVDLSAVQEKALNLVLNHWEAQGRFDPAKLARVLKDLESLPELELSGFEAGSHRDLTLEALPAEAAFGSPDEAAGDVSAAARPKVEVSLQMPEAVFEAKKYDWNSWWNDPAIEVRIRRGTAFG